MVGTEGFVLCGASDPADGEGKYDDEDDDDEEEPAATDGKKSG